MIETSTCINPCAKCCNIPLPPAFIPSNKLDDEPITYDTEGSWGPFAWTVHVVLYRDDISRSSFAIHLTFFGLDIINVTLDKDHTAIPIDLTFGGVGLKATLGVDFTNKYVYLDGTLDFRVYKKKFHIILFKF